MWVEVNNNQVNNNHVSTAGNKGEKWRQDIRRHALEHGGKNGETLQTPKVLPFINLSGVLC